MDEVDDVIDRQQIVYDVISPHTGQSHQSSFVHRDDDQKQARGFGECIDCLPCVDPQDEDKIEALAKEYLQ